MIGIFDFYMYLTCMVTKTSLSTCTISLFGTLSYLLLSFIFHLWQGLEKKNLRRLLKSSSSLLFFSFCDISITSSGEVGVSSKTNRKCCLSLCVQFNYFCHYFYYVVNWTIFNYLYIYLFESCIQVKNILLASKDCQL